MKAARAFQRRLAERRRLCSARAAIRAAERRIARRRRLARPAGYSVLLHPAFLAVMLLGAAALVWA